uniref:Phosphatidylinositol 4-kinase n=1 Tax=Lygus hesperus TaxID=30085 RepID=A0A0A9X2K1_LYGHE
MARRRFVESMAAYSLFCYLFQVKDRHNGNILLNADGRVIHIDFDYILTTSPGRNINFESAPFKLTSEYVEVMGGLRSHSYSYFCKLFVDGLIVVRRHIRCIEAVLRSFSQSYPASHILFSPSVDAVVTAFTSRCFIGLTDDDAASHAASLLDEACNHWRSTQYDKYQRITRGIL